MENRINILYIIDQLNIGGTEKQLMEVIDRLDRKKFVPYLMCLRRSDYFTECKVDCHKKILGVKSLASLDGIWKLLKFAIFLRKKEIDIIQTFFIDATILGVLAAWLARVKVILSSRRDMGFWYTRKILLVLYVVNLLTDRFVVNSKAIKNNVHKKEHVSLERIDVIYNGVNPEQFSVKHDLVNLRLELNIPQRDKVVGIIANLNRKVKRVDLFVETAAFVLEKNPHVSFVIVGEGYLREDLECQAQSLGIKQKISFVGSQKDVVPYLQLMDAGVLTSDSEGFSNAILEYMAAALPVICIDSGGNSELVEDGVNGFLVRTHCATNIAEKIIEVINDENLLSQITGQNLKKIRRWGWDNVRQEIEDYYLSLVG